jgi:hypothetical protein
LCSHSHSEARIIFWPGKNRDGWFTAKDLLTQVNNTIDIFDGLTRGYAQALFIFDNAPSHRKRADDALMARNMPKGAQFFFQCFLFSIPTGPKNGWTPHAGGPCMRSGKLPTGEDQLIYYPDDHPSMPGWFKGMEQILHERGLWPEEGLPVRDCHGYTRGNPWAFKRAQEEPKRISNEGDMVQILF